MMATKHLAWTGSIRARRSRSAWPGAALGLVLCGYAAGISAHGESHQAEPADAQAGDSASTTPVAARELGQMSIPDVVLLNQDGREVRFYSDLVKNKTVAINFVYTSCTTICTPMGAVFANLQDRMGARAGKDVQLISISVDPVVDTPQRLKAWGAKFDAGPGWTLLTGSKRDVDDLLKTLKVFTPDVEDHSPILLIGNERKGRWVRAYGLTAPAKLAGIIDSMSGLSQVKASVKASTGQSMAAEYFTDATLVDQRGEKVRLYSDLLKGHVVIINTFYASCEGACPVTMGKVQAIQSWLGDRLGSEVHILSITVDAENDTPQRIREYAERFNPRPGWYFLTGVPENVAFVLAKLGQRVDNPGNHKNILIVGNEPTGLWKKALVLAQPAELLEIVDSVLRDGV